MSRFPKASVVGLGERSVGMPVPLKATEVRVLDKRPSSGKGRLTGPVAKSDPVVAPCHRLETFKAGKYEVHPCG